MNLNKCMIIGRVTRDPEVRTTPNGATVATFSMATNHHWTDKQGQKQEDTQFHNIVLWGRIAEIAGQYLTKGQEAYIEGRMVTRKYTDKEGVERRAFEIVGEVLQLGSKPKGSGEYAGGGQYDQPAPRDNGSQPEPKESVPTIQLDEQDDEIRLEDVPF